MGGVDDVDDLQRLRLHDDPGLLVQLPHGGLGDGFTGFGLADGEIPHALPELGVLTPLEEQDPAGGLVVDDDGGDEQSHGEEETTAPARVAQPPEPPSAGAPVMACVSWPIISWRGTPSPLLRMTPTQPVSG